MMIQTFAMIVVHISDFGIACIRLFCFWKKNDEHFLKILV